MKEGKVDSAILIVLIAGIFWSFGALSGQGLVDTKLKNYEKAIKSYQAVQKIYPSIRAAKVMIPQLRKLIKDEVI